MKLFHELKRTITCLQPWNGCWALCGGVVASVYRDIPRFTGDIDIAVVDHESGNSASEVAEKVLSDLGYPVAVGFVPNPRGGGAQKKALICGRSGDDQRFIGVDFLLPIFPWLQKGVQRAQSNLIDYGFEKIPTLTAEDLILAKLNALQIADSRPQDTDDIQAILRTSLPIDFHYILREARALNFIIPDWFSKRTQ